MSLMTVEFLWIAQRPSAQPIKAPYITLGQFRGGLDKSYSKRPVKGRHVLNNPPPAECSCGVIT